MLKTRWVTFVAAVTMAASVQSASSDAILVDSMSDSKHWKTAFTNEVPLRWSWATNAVRAELAITGMGGALGE